MRSPTGSSRCAVGETTGIGWCDHTFNPWIGCDKVSPGCAHCYAETLTTGRMGLSVWGAHAPRRIAAESTWKNPAKWDRAAARDGVRRRVFCASLADVFEPRLELDRVRFRLFELIEATPNLDWLLLTKRPDYAKSFLVTGRRATPDEVDAGYEFGIVPAWYYDRMDLPTDPVTGIGYLPNLWIGVSIENTRFTWRADVLREIPAAVRFISAEPLLGSLYDSRPLDATDPAGLPDGDDVTEGGALTRRRSALDLTAIDWVIVGGESGPGARPFGLRWAREIMYAAESRDIAVFMKQLGAKPVDDDGLVIRLDHRKGEDPSEWDRDLRVQAFPR